MDLSNHELIQIGQALSYAVIYGKTEKEIAEFAMLKITVEEEIIRLYSKRLSELQQLIP
ncbi:MAG: hypothetical protein WCI49_13625 [Ferruginibacter sp.]